MLQFAGGIGLGVDVGDLLELQAALQAGGAVQIAADVEHVVVVEIPGGIILDLLMTESSSTWVILSGRVCSSS